MDEARAREILKACIEPDGLHNLGWYLSWHKDSSIATLDGQFDIEDLEAIVWWMRKGEHNG